MMCIAGLALTVNAAWGSEYISDLLKERELPLACSVLRRFFRMTDAEGLLNVLDRHPVSHYTLFP